MIVCIKCRCEMRCKKNGVGIHFGGGHVYAGDKFQCPKCDTEVVSTGPVAVSHHDPKKAMHDEYIEMEK